jgi:Spy/CpxP family protein refolding chaperone
MIGKNLLILILAFLTVFGAGVVVEHVWRHVADTDHHDSFLKYQLNLTQQQTDQMRKIFDDAMSHSRETFDARRRDLVKERDDAIRALIPATNQQHLDQILADFTTKMGQLDSDRRLVFVAAHDRIKREVLTADQAVKFDELTKQHEEQRQQNGHHHGGPMSQPSDMSPAPTTQPSHG